MSAVTDPNRIRKDDKGNPDNCEVIYKYWEIFGSEAEIENIGNACKEALMGCAECKRKLAEKINSELSASYVKSDTFVPLQTMAK